MVLAWHSARCSLSRCSSCCWSSPTAEAKLRVGVGDQNAAMFDSSRWQSLKLKRTRYIVPWDWAKVDWQRAEVEYFMNRARAAKQQVLVTFSARRGCWNGVRYSRSKACRAPSAKAYKNSFARFDNAFPWVKTYSPWNEVNHVSQPTYRKPGLAVRYYEVLRKLAGKRGFKVMAADMLDTSNMAPYLRAFLRQAKGSPRLWGLHNYQDVNYRTSADTRLMLSLVPGEVWLTETGGIVKFGASSTARAVRPRARSGCSRSPTATTPASAGCARRSRSSSCSAGSARRPAARASTPAS